MQHYLGCAIGFNSNIIHKDDWSLLSNIDNIDEHMHLNPSSDSFSFTIVPHTEDAFDMPTCSDWSSIVLKDIASISMVKAISFSEMKKIHDIYFPLSSKHRSEILQVLSQFGLEKYIEQVEVITYSYCC